MASAAVSSALAGAPRTATQGWFKVPNSYAENQHLLQLPASRALALVIFRRAGDGGSAVVSDRMWEAWTGFKSRQKEYAVKELSAFGLQVDGRGDTAKLTWDHARWNEAVKTRQAPAVYDPNRKAREQKAVTAKAGFKVSEECRDHGCSKLRDGGCSQSLQNETKQKTSLFLTPIAQPVAQMAKKVVAESESLWAASMQALNGLFPLVGWLFLVRLLSLVRAVFPDVTDSEMARALELSSIKGQKSEGFWITANGSERLIRAVKLIRRSDEAAAGGDKNGPPGGAGGDWIDAGLGRSVDALRARGLDDVASEVEALIGSDDPLKVESELSAIEHQMIRRHYWTLDDKAGLRAQADALVKKTPGSASMMAEQLDSLRALELRRLVRELCKLPSLSVLSF